MAASRPRAAADEEQHGRFPVQRADAWSGLSEIVPHVPNLTCVPLPPWPGRESRPASGPTVGRKPTGGTAMRPARIVVVEVRGTEGLTMYSLHQRLKALDRQVGDLRLHRDSGLLAALNGGRFTREHLDQLYGVVEAPLRAGALFSGAAFRAIGGNPVSGPGTPMTGFGMVLAHRNHPQINGALRDAWNFTIPVNVRDRTILEVSDSRYRVRRGLLQRLVERHGLDNLQAAMPACGYKNFDPEFLPVLARTESARVEAIEAGLGGQKVPDMSLLLWKTEEGTIKLAWMASTLDEYGQEWTS